MGYLTESDQSIYNVIEALWEEMNELRYELDGVESWDSEYRREIKEDDPEYYEQCKRDHEESIKAMSDEDICALMARIDAFKDCIDIAEGTRASRRKRYDKRMSEWRRKNSGWYG